MLVITSMDGSVDAKIIKMEPDLIDKLLTAHRLPAWVSAGHPPAARRRPRHTPSLEGARSHRVGRALSGEKGGVMTKTSTIERAMRTLELQSDDGVANAACLEAADRLRVMRKLLRIASGKMSYGLWPSDFRQSPLTEVSGLSLY